jgi:hypothetical protein
MLLPGAGGTVPLGSTNEALRPLGSSMKVIIVAALYLSAICWLRTTVAISRFLDMIGFTKDTKAAAENTAIKDIASQFCLNQSRMINRVSCDEDFI